MKINRVLSRWSITVALGACLNMGIACRAMAQDYRDSVVKVFMTSNEPDFRRPWQSLGSRSATGSGCILTGNRILTNAHVVEDSTFIQVRKESSPKKYTAIPVVVAHECDLAILTVDDPEFFKGVPAIEIGGVPRLQDQVTVIGFPLGGDKVSITEGVVSRIEVIRYAQSAKRLLGIQIDAAINPGNSGGPVFQNGKLVGIAMQVISQSQNIGYMIPVPVIRHFLDDIDDGVYDGFPLLGVEYFSTENTALKEVYQIPDSETGVLVTHVQPFSAAEGVLERDDVILAVDGIPIAEDGTFPYRDLERLIFPHIINQKRWGEDVTFDVLRNGEVLQTSVVLDKGHYLLPPPNALARPSYYIYQGLVFSVLTIDLLQSWGERWWETAPFDFLYFLVGKGRLNEDRRKEVVVLLDIMADERNIGYFDFSNQAIISVNGTVFSSFAEFVQLVESAEGEYITFETLDNARIILSAKDSGAVTDQIAERNVILQRSSKDVEKFLKN